MNPIIKKIFKEIKKYDTIVIARHIGPDPDAIASQLALRDAIKETFPNKKVYAGGSGASKFKYLGLLDKIDDININEALLILTDVPDKRRVDIANIDNYKFKIKIDHHPFVEEFCDIEWIDDTASSASQMLMEFVLETKMKITVEIAEKLFVGLITDTNRFLYDYTTLKTFELVSKIIKKTDLKFTKLYEKLYLRPLSEIKFQNYILDNFTITKNGLAYLILDKEALAEHKIDAATVGNMVGNYNYIEDFVVWAIFSYDTENENYRGNLRSRGPIINKIAAKFNGGGHAMASGVRLKEKKEIKELIKELDKHCEKYKNK